MRIPHKKRGSTIKLILEKGRWEKSKAAINISFMNKLKIIMIKTLKKRTGSVERLSMYIFF